MSDSAGTGTVTAQHGPLLDLLAQPAVLVIEGVFAHLNLPALALFSSSLDRLVGAKLSDVVEGGSELDLEELARGEGERVAWRGGSALTHAHALDGQAGAYILVMDTMQRESLASRMADYADAAAEGVLIADAVGGINDPLASLLMSLEDAADRLETDPANAETEEFGQLIFEARDSAQRVAQVVREVLSLPRVPAQLVPVDINDMIERVVRSVRRQRMTLPVECVLGVCAPIAVPQERLEQVLAHLLLTAPAPVEGQPVRVLTSQPGEDVVIEVQSGGVPHEDARTFRRRYTVVTSLVQQMGGGCEASTGSEAVNLVLRFGGTSTKVTELSASRRSRSSAPPRGELRILVVDDEPSIHRALKRALRDVGVVHSVGSGNGAIEVLVGGGTFDVILCDMVMANGTGLDLANWLDLNEPRLKRRMVLMTGMGDADSISHPDVVTLAKPFDSLALRELVVQVASRG